MKLTKQERYAEALKKKGYQEVESKGGPLPIPPVVGWHSVQIGEYYIGQVPGGYWIEHESGEGMHVSQGRMEKLIADFYKENF